jgi:hypothetical protein
MSRRLLRERLYISLRCSEEICYSVGSINLRSLRDGNLKQNVFGLLAEEVKKLNLLLSG